MEEGLLGLRRWPFVALLLGICLRCITTQAFYCSQSSSSSTVVARWRGDLSVVHPLQAKGGNKKKAGGRKGQKKGGSSSDDYDSDGYDDDYSQAPAPRVSSNIPHVRRQIAFVRQMKELTKSVNNKGAGQRTTYKNKKGGVQKDALAMGIDYWEEEKQLPQTVLLVDGYNVINAWQKTIKARSAGGMANARNVLVEELIYLYYAKGWKIIVAFDEHTPGTELRVEEGEVDEVYTGTTESADSYIQKKSKELVRKGVPNVMVSSDDRAVQVLSAGAGAQILSTSQIIKDIYIARKQLLYSGMDWTTVEAGRSLEDEDDFLT